MLIRSDVPCHEDHFWCLEIFSNYSSLTNYNRFKILCIDREIVCIDRKFPTRVCVDRKFPRWHTPLTPSQSSRYRGGAILIKVASVNL